MHETPFGAQAHEARSGRDSHERAAQTYGARLLRATHGQRERPRLPRTPVVRPGNGGRTPTTQARHAATAAGRAPAVQHRRRLPPKHHLPFIQARHLARLAWAQEERQYRLEVRRWRQLLRGREELLRTLDRLERRLARWASEAAKRAAESHRRTPARIYAIDGMWFEQIGRGRRREPRVRH